MGKWRGFLEEKCSFIITEALIWAAPGASQFSCIRIGGKLPTHRPPYMNSSDRHQSHCSPAKVCIRMQHQHQLILLLRSFVGIRFQRTTFSAIFPTVLFRMFSDNRCFSFLFTETEAKFKSSEKNVTSSTHGTSSTGLKVKRERGSERGRERGERDQALSKTIKTRQLEWLK